MLDKVVRDGNVAILITTEYGTGWSSWIDVEGIETDPGLVAMVESSTEPDVLETYCRDKWGTLYFYGGAENLSIVWVPEGTEYVITEYDGWEEIQLKNSIEWRTA
jgi:hypothetical protein